MASSKKTGRREVELEGEIDKTEMASVVLNFSLLDLGLGEDRGVSDSGSTKAYRGLNLAPLCSAGDRGLGSLGLSVVQCIRKAAVVLPGSQKHRRSLKQRKKERKLSWNILFSRTDCCV